MKHRAKSSDVPQQRRFRLDLARLLCPRTFVDPSLSENKMYRDKNTYRDRRFSHGPAADLDRVLKRVDVDEGKREVFVTGGAEPRVVSIGFLRGVLQTLGPVGGNKDCVRLDFNEKLFSRETFHT